MGKIKKVVTTGLGLALAAAAGAYILYERNAKARNRMRGWAVKFKGEVLEQMEKLKDINKETFQDLVDRVGLRYKTLAQVNQGELKGLMADVKAAWKKFSARAETLKKRGPRNGDK